MGTGIIKHEPNNYALLAQSPKWSMLDKVEAKKKLTDMMQHATILNGGTKEPDPSIFKIHIDSIYEDLLTVYSWLTVAELQTVFREGLRGTYGQFFGLSYKTVSDWIIGYRDSPERKEYMTPPKPEPITIMLTKEQKERDDREYLEYSYATYTPDWKLNMVDPLLFNIIRKNGLDTLTDEQKKKIRIAGLDAYVEYKNDPLMNVTIEIKDPDVIIDKINKRLATIELFHQWRKEGKTQIF